MLQFAHLALQVQCHIHQWRQRPRPTVISTNQYLTNEMHEEFKTVCQLCHVFQQKQKKCLSKSLFKVLEFEEMGGFFFPLAPTVKHPPLKLGYIYQNHSECIKKTQCTHALLCAVFLWQKCCGKSITVHNWLQLFLFFFNFP